MEIYEFKNDILRQIENRKQGNPSTKSIEINLTDFPKDMVDLSEILLDLFREAEMDRDDADRPVAKIS